MENRDQRVEKRLNYIEPKQPLNPHQEKMRLANRNEHRINQSSILNPSKLTLISNERQSTQPIEARKNYQFLENKVTTRYKIKHSSLPMKSRYELPKGNIGSPTSREPIKINRAELSMMNQRKENIYQTRTEQPTRKSLTIKQEDLQRIKEQSKNKPLKLSVGKNGKITKEVSVSNASLLNNRIAKNRQGIVLDRITNKLIDDHIDEVDIGYQATYTTNRKRKALVRGTRGVKHFVQSGSRTRFLASGAKHSGVLQAQGMAMGALESANPVTDTASTATGRTATNVKTTKEVLKKGKNLLRGKKAMNTRNVVRERNRFAKMKGIRQNTAKLLQKGSSGIQRIGSVFLARLEQALASKGILILAILFGAILLFGVALGGSSGALQMEEEEQLSFSSVGLSESVLQWKDTVETELAKYNLTEYVDLLLVIIQLESKGNLPDVMQSSESIGLAPNTITDPIHSIEVGVAHFKSTYDDMNSHNVDLQTLIQSYNFGNGFISYVANNGGVWKQSLSDKFADLYAQRLGWNSYGDKNYVSKAMKYLTIDEEAISLKGAEFDLAGGKLAYPVPGYESAVSSSYGWRTDPYTFERTFHNGTDIPAPIGTIIIAAADGIVIEAGWKGGYGNAVVINHGSNVTTLYAHNSSLAVHAGQTVKAGQVIARVGSTGRSTGPHLHFEVRKNGEYTNPINWLN